MLRSALIAILALSATAVMGHPVEIVAGDYQGEYCIDSRNNCMSGDKPLDIATGTHTLILALGTSLSFSVSQTGKVTSHNQEAVYGPGTGNVLTFQTTKVDVRRGNYKGAFWIEGPEKRNESDPGLARDREVTVLKALTGYIFGIAPGNAFHFDVDENGYVRVTDTMGAIGQGRRLNLLARRITVTPDDATIPWHIRMVESRYDKASGARDVWVMSDLTGYILEIGARQNTRFTVDAGGNPAPSHLLILKDGDVIGFAAARVDDDVLVCRFRASLTLQDDISNTLEKGAVLDLEARLVIDKNPSYPGTDNKQYDWRGLAIIDDRLGGQTISMAGLIAVVRGASQDALAVDMRDIEGSIGGIAISNQSALVTLLGVPGTLPAAELPEDLAIWNELNAYRFFIVRGLAGSPGGTVSGLLPTGVGCE